MVCRKKWKYLIGLLAALIMTLGLGMTAFAQNTDSDDITFKIETSVSGHDVTLSWTPLESVEYYCVYDMFGRELTEEPIQAPDFTGTEVEPLVYVINDLECSTISYKYTVKGFAMVEKIVDSGETDGSDAEDGADGSDAEDGADGSDAEDGTDGSSAGDGADGNAPEGELETEWVETEVCADTAEVDVWMHMSDPVFTECKFVSANTAVVRWDAIENAGSYNVYRRTGNGAWIYIATVSDTSYVDESVKLGTDYSYSVRAISQCCKNLSEAYAATAFQVKPTAITSINTSSSGIQVHWKSVEGADGYHLYAKLDSGSWKKLISTTDTSYNYALDKSNWGKKVYFYVVSYCDAYTANPSAQKYTIFQPTAPTLKSAYASGTSKNVINWNKMSGVVGYKVYRKTGSSSWSCIATIENGSATSYSDTSITLGTTYTYTVAGYWKSGSTVEVGYYNTTGLTVKPVVTIKYLKVKDSDSIMYGKTLKIYCDANGNVLQNSEKYIDASRYYLYVNKDKQYVTAYCKDGSYYVPVRTMICSTGKTLSHTPNGTFSTKAKYRWHELDGPCWGQYCTRIVGGVLFHSVYYDSYNNPVDLAVSQYNKLGKRASHGCVRLTVEGAKWIYDKCKLGTTVVIHQKTGYEPLDKPTSYKLAKDHTWDPTDPAQKWRCEEKGCH